MNEFLLTVRTPWYYFQYQNRAQVELPTPILETIYDH